MIINIPYDFDREAQKELCAQIVVKDTAIKEIIMTHLYKMDYYERQDWIENNAISRKEITEDQLGRCLK